MSFRDRMRITPRRQRVLAWLMEVGLVGMVFVGLYYRNTGVVVNAGVGVLVTQLPPVLERNFEIPMDASLTLWITSAVFLHALGTVGIPGSGLSFYKSIWWWDHMTHALSASVVAAAGYATARAVDEHSASVRLPDTFMFVFILLVTLAFGVFWEVIEFALSELSHALGSGSVLTQYGIGDTMLDLVFDSVGAVIVATWGTAYLTDVAGALTARLGSRTR